MNNLSLSSEEILAGLNPEQRKGVLTTEGPVLLLAGAGSGKTRVITHRTAYLLAEKKAEPYQIMAITFTNKAAGEMRERINDLVGFGADQIWVSTFHSACVRILRRFIVRLGYTKNFTIYDTDDQKAAMKAVMKELEIDPKRFREKTFLNKISSAKDELIGPEDYMKRADGDFIEEKTGQVYRAYQERLKAANALDFDDLLMLTDDLLKNDREIRAYYQDRIHYLMVDEYQDTNTAQFDLVRLLAGDRKNLCVVGDDDQSIYKFRGANIYNILNFEKYFPEAAVIRLEQNYRSTQMILDAANAVIKNNEGRKVKKLWTENPKGDRIRFRDFDSAFEEAEFISDDIRRKVTSGRRHYGDIAVLYRTNAQSRLLEEKMVEDNVPYRIIGGVNFYQRAEIRDLISYLKVVNNTSDEVAVRRVINVPKRGIGQTTVNKVGTFAYANHMTFFEALMAADRIPTIGKAAGKIRGFTDLIRSLSGVAGKHDIPDLLKALLDETGYTDLLEAEGTDEAKARLENIDELISKAASYQKAADGPSLGGFLDEVALIADIDNLPETSDYVVLMTLHSAKGLEFPEVYMAGMEDGLFPSYLSITAEDKGQELEEERRLCYVGITRAKEDLTLTMARQRMVRGEVQYGSVSRFVKEIPEGLLDEGGGEVFAPVREPVREREAFQDRPRPERRARSLKRTRPGAAAYPDLSKGVTIQKAPLSYTVGDRVLHQKFGEGEVTDIRDGGRDFEVTVDFDRVGVKKMFASFARLVKK